MLKPELINGRTSSHLIKQGSYDRHIESFLTISQNKKPHRETFIHSSSLHVQTTCINCLVHSKTKWQNSKNVYVEITAIGLLRNLL